MGTASAPETLLLYQIPKRLILEDRNLIPRRCDILHNGKFQQQTVKINASKISFIQNCIALTMVYDSLMQSFFSFVDFARCLVFKTNNDVSGADCASVFKQGNTPDLRGPPS
jgi:hypothetical protein